MAMWRDTLADVGRYDSVPPTVAGNCGQAMLSHQLIGDRDSGFSLASNATHGTRVLPGRFDGLRFSCQLLVELRENARNSGRFA